MSKKHTLEQSLGEAKTRIAGVAKDLVAEAMSVFDDAKEIATDAKGALEKRGKQALDAVGLQPRRSLIAPVAVAFGLGAAIAGGLVLFLSPKTGKEMRALAGKLIGRAAEKIPAIG